MKSQEDKKRVFVALSGGVDSAVAAALLKERGYDVTGVFIKIWQPEFLECTWREDRLDAMRVAAALGIPFEEVDFSDVYKKEVIDDMLAAYKRGITPNPDVLCNRHIKFGALWEWAQAQGADYIATGHHARVKKVYTQVYTSKNKSEERALGSPASKWGLLRGVDAGKDQSYFLWQLTQNDLAHTLMPVGEMTKEEVRAYAEKLHLPVAKKADSQGLCFVGDIDMHEFLQRYIETEGGEVRDTSGNVIGKHDGAMLYTTGQRHGFRVIDSAAATVPQYVISTDIRKNQISVSPEPKEDAGVTQVRIHNTNWIQDTKAYRGELSCAMRYRQTPISCTVKKEKEHALVNLKSPHIATAGQSLVVYCEDECLGGGIISHGQ